MLLLLYIKKVRKGREMFPFTVGRIKGIYGEFVSYIHVMKTIYSLLPSLLRTLQQCNKTKTKAIIAT